MVKIFCDRCGQDITGKERIKWSCETKYITYDVCTNCHGKLMDVLHGFEVKYE